jgi:hypothetical protein
MNNTDNHKWSFIIESPITNYIYNLSIYNLNDVCIIEEPDGLTYLFSSIHLNDVENPQEALKKAYQLTALIDGVSYLIHENKDEYSPIKLSRIINNETNESFCCDAIPINNIFDVNFSINNNIEPNNVIAVLISLAKTEKFILNLLIFFSQGITYINLYKALDEMKSFLKNNNRTTKELGFRDCDISKFKHTANNYEVIGTSARHGTQGNTPPSNTFSLKESKKLITDIAIKILEDFFKIKISIQKDRFLPESWDF